MGNTTHKITDINTVIFGGNDQIYSTHAVFPGQVTLEHEADATITQLTLTLEGASATHVSSASNIGPAAGRAKGRHHFLKLQHPLDASLLVGSTTEDGRGQIHLPFVFVIPESILPGTCNHKTANADVKAAHLLLPPTLEEDHYVKGLGARTSYAIRVRASLQIVSTGASQNESRSFGIRVVPTGDEEPPVGIYDDQLEYCLHHTLSVKSAFRKVLGELTAETSQPPCLYLKTPTAEEETITTAVKLTFAPARQEESPPEITAISSKLREYSYFAAVPFEDLPRPRRAYATMMLYRSYVEDFTLSSRKLSNVSWTKYVGDPSSRTQNATSAAPPSFPRSCTTSFTTSISLPVTIPKVHNSKGSKQFSSSFHSCLVSRTHAVEFEVHVKNNSTITLRAPI